MPGRKVTLRGGVCMLGMSTKQELLPLQEVASRSGVNEDRLRLWCATGLLACERIGRRWMLATECLDEVARLAVDGGRRRATAEARRVAIAAMFRSTRQANEALERIDRRKIARWEASSAPMSLDQLDGVLLAVTVEAHDADAVVAIAEACDGAVIAELRADAKGG